MPIHVKGSGGGALPSLSNPATTQDVRSGKQFIDADGNKQRGELSEFHFTDVYFVLANASTNAKATCFAQTTAKIFSVMDGSALSAAGTLVLDFSGAATATMTHAAIYNIYGSSTPLPTGTGASGKMSCFLYDTYDGLDVTTVGSFMLTVAADNWGESALALKALSKSITLESGRSYLVEIYKYQGE